MKRVINIIFTVEAVDDIDKFCGQNAKFDNRSILIRTAVKELIHKLKEEEMKEKNINLK
jgi:metal-responsive CopG/Arc/MetJ family transcriptional regulator